MNAYIHIISMKIGHLLVTLFLEHYLIVVECTQCSAPSGKLSSKSRTCSQASKYSVHVQIKVAPESLRQSLNVVLHRLQARAPERRWGSPRKSDLLAGTISHRSLTKRSFHNNYSSCTTTSSVQSGFLNIKRPVKSSRGKRERVAHRSNINS